MLASLACSRSYWCRWPRRPRLRTREDPSRALSKTRSGAVLPGVTVEAHSPILVGVATATTDTSGVYRFPALAPGVYEVTATLPGFQTAKVENIQLGLGQILKVDFAVQIASVSESVSVSAESPLIDVKQNAASATHHQGHHRPHPASGRDLDERPDDGAGRQRRVARRRFAD